MKQKGLIKLSGTFDDLNFYEHNGVQIARRKPEVSKNKRKNSPAMQVQRDNAAEFRLAVKLAGQFRRACLYNLKGYNDQEGNEQLTRIIRTMITCGNGRRGERGFDLAGNKHFLRNYSFSQAVRLDEILFVPFTLQCATGRNEATLTVPASSHRPPVVPPDHATHYRLTFCIGTISNYSFAGKDGYQPDGNDASHHAMIRSGIMSLKEPSNPGYSLTVQLPGLPVVDAATSLIACLGIDFIETINGDYSFSPYRRTMKVVEIF